MGTGGPGPDPPPPPKKKKSQKIGFLSNTGPDPLTNHKATKPAFNVWPSSAHQQNDISMVFRWRAYDGPFIVVCGSSIPHPKKKKKKKKVIKFGPPLTKLSGSADDLEAKTVLCYIKINVIMKCVTKGLQCTCKYSAIPS